MDVGREGVVMCLQGSAGKSVLGWICRKGRLCLEFTEGFKRRGRSKSGKCVLGQGFVEKGDCV